MLKITCPDGIDLKFLDETSVEYTVEDGTLTVKNVKTKEVLLRLDEGKWTNYIHMDENDSTYTKNDGTSMTANWEIIPDSNTIVGKIAD